MGEQEHSIRYEVEEWGDFGEPSSIEYSEYWNDAKREEHKAWNVLDGDFGKMERYLMASPQSVEDAFPSFLSDNRMSSHVQVIAQRVN